MDPAEYAKSARFLEAAKMYSLASCVMLFYDMALTFGDEVEKIWKQPFTGATVLWFMNRYISPLGYIVITVSFHDPNWSASSCNRYVLFPEILKVFSALAVGVIFILRLYAVYARNQYILYCFSCLLVAELCVKIWSFTGGTRLQLPPGLVGCILTGKPGSDRVMFTWIAELGFDSSVFVAMLYRSVHLYNSMSRGRVFSVVRTMLRDGIIYFAVIFASNLVTVIIYAVATPDLKVVNASFSTLITTLMVSRLMLNLRRQTDDDLSEYAMSSGPSMSITIPSYPKGGGRRPRRVPRGIISTRDIIPMTIMGNLDQPVSTWEDQDNSDYSDVRS